MKKEELRKILITCVPRNSVGFQAPATSEWDSLEKRFGCQFPSDMKKFIDLMSEFAFPGDILNVGAGPHNGNDTIESVYEFELQHSPSWRSEMVPFFSIGNGDYFCVSSVECPDTPVYYFYADREQFQRYSNSFVEWVVELPTFLK